MEEELEAPTPPTTSTSTTTDIFPDDFDSACSTPYVSAPSSPGNCQPLGGYYYSAPASPMHLVLSTTTFTTCKTSQGEPSSSLSSASSFEFDFSAKLTTDGATSPGSMTMSSADELFFNGQIRPMKLSTHLQRPQMLAPLLHLEENDQELEDKDHEACLSRGRDVKLRDKPLRRRTRSLSPLRSVTFDWRQDCESDEIVVVQNEAKQSDAADDDKHEDEEVISSETTPCGSGTSSRSSSVGRSSKRWVFLKEFLYRSKSEGRNNGNKFWNGLSFSPVKDKKMEKMEKLKIPRMKPSSDDASKEKSATSEQMKQQNPVKDPKKRLVNRKAVNGVMRKRRVPPSAHELHYTANRAQSEEMRKKTFLPYRQGLLGCLGFSSKSYGAWNGFTKALNPVSSR